MKKLFFVLLFGLSAQVFADGNNIIVSSCGAGPSGSVGQLGYTTVDQTGKQCTSASASGTSTVQGSGIAGTPAGGVLSVQGVSSGTALPVLLAPSSSSSAGITPVISASAESSHILKAGAGNLYSVDVTNGATAGLVMVFNATSAPGDGAVTPVYCWPMPAANTGMSRTLSVPSAFATGITVVYSTGTNCFNKTASATAFFSGQVQ